MLNKKRYVYIIVIGCGVMFVAYMGGNVNGELSTMLTCVLRVICLARECLR